MQIDRRFHGSVCTAREEAEQLRESKFDGLSVEVRYDCGRFTMAATRGDCYTGDEVTANARNAAATGPGAISRHPRNPPSNSRPSRRLISRGEGSHPAASHHSTVLTIAPAEKRPASPLGRSIQRTPGQFA